MKMKMDSMTAKMRIHWIIPMTVILPLGLPVTPQCPPLRVSAHFHPPHLHSHTSHPLRKRRPHQHPPQTSMMRNPSIYQQFLLIHEKTIPLLSRRLCINHSLSHNTTDPKEKRRVKLFLSPSNIHLPPSLSNSSSVVPQPLRQARRHRKAHT